MMSQQQRIAIAAREIQLQRCEPLIWRHAQRLAQQRHISPNLAYTQLRSRQIEYLEDEDTSAANDDLIATGAYPVAPREGIEAALRQRARRSLIDIAMVLLGIGCVALVWMHMLGKI